MLLGRDAELARIRQLVEAAHSGRGGALRIHGQAGIGKTALLEAARGSADGATVLSARGIESESSLPFVALRDLAGPVLDRGEALPAAQWEALAGALALAPPAPGDRLAVCVATLGLLEGAGPLLVLVDDLQWLDVASLECVLYAARRAPEGVAFLFTAREDGSAARGDAAALGAPATLGDEAADLPTLHLGPLDDAAAAAVLERVAPDLADDVRAAVVAASAGNPLALVELPDTLTGEQRRGAAPLEQPLAPLNGLGRVFAARARALPPPARQAVLVAAASQTDALAPVLAACRELGVGPEDLQAAETAGLVTLDAERVTFVHPLVRGGAYHGASAAERRAAHRTLAGVVADESRAWHLAAAALGPDEEAAAALEAAAGSATMRRAYAVAADALERSARLTEDDAHAAGRLLGAGAAALSSGRSDRAEKLLAEASERAGDPMTHAAAEHLRGVVAMWSGRVTDAMEILERSADLAAANPPMAAVVLGDAAFACSAAGDCPRAVALAERAAALLDDDAEPAVRAPVLAILAWSLVLSGETRRARPIFDEVERLRSSVDPLSPAMQLIEISTNARLPSEDPVGAFEHALALADTAREAGSLFALPNPLSIAAVAAQRLGLWDEVAPLTAESIAAAQESAQMGPGTLAAIMRARVAAARGDEAASRADAEGALAFAETAGAWCFRVYGRQVLCALELAMGRVDAAIREGEITERVAAESGLEEPTLIPWAPDLVEAYVRAGRADDAQRVLATLERQAEGADTSTARSFAARCRGLVEPDGYDEHFAAAMELHETVPMPFERGRTLLAWGMRLHRARRRAEAREKLRAAAEIFEDLGAAPWAAQARDELRAAGGRRREGLGDELSPQEERVAHAAARGATTREIAAELYLAPKTIEFHLGRIYRKLGVGSRTGLAAALSERSRSRG